MVADKFLLLWPNLSLAMLLIVFSIPLVGRRVKMNRVFGVKIKKAFESEENWYRINAYGGRCMIAWGIALAVISVAAFFLLPISNNTEPDLKLSLIMTCGIPVGVLIPGMLQILVYAKKL